SATFPVANFYAHSTTAPVAPDRLAIDTADYGFYKNTCQPVTFRLSAGGFPTTSGTSLNFTLSSSGAAWHCMPASDWHTSAVSSLSFSGGYTNTEKTLYLIYSGVSPSSVLLTPVNSSFSTAHASPNGIIPRLIHLTATNPVSALVFPALIVSQDLPVNQCLP